MIIDFWYDDHNIAYADCFFYPNEGVYRGNVYNENREMIGDYTSRDSIEIEKMFPGIFGE